MAMEDLSVETNETVVSLLSKEIGNHVSPKQLEQAQLCLRCINLEGDDLDSAKQILELYYLVSSEIHRIPFSGRKCSPVAIIKVTLLAVGVGEAGKLPANDEELEIAGHLLAFPKLLLEICRRLGSNDFCTLKGSICMSVLKYNPNNISSPVDLMMKLLHQTKIAPGNVDVLLKWLPMAGRDDLAEKVKEYKTAQQAAASYPSQMSRTRSMQETGQDCQGASSQSHVSPTAPLASVNTKVTTMANKVGVSEGDLSRRVLERHLEEIAKLIPEQWHECIDFLSAGAESAHRALIEWYEEAVAEATYRALVEQLCAKNKINIAEKICKLAKVVRFCMETHQQATSYMSIPQGAHAGSVRINYLWDIKNISKLKVFFMNPEELRKPGKVWLTGDNETLNTVTILAWATGSWNDRHSTSYPQISTDPALTIDESHIRVKFGTTGVSWSYVGRDAQTHQDEPTMYLNLYNMTTQDQISMVLHEFGHALGLEHEHQRSDFWDVLRDLLVCKEDELPGSCAQHLRFSFEEGTSRTQTSYDPDSIMHYWFDINWLKPKYHDMKKVKCMELSDQQRKVIEGVHKRDYHKGLLGKKPSETDYRTLEEAYKQLAGQVSEL